MKETALKRAGALIMTIARRSIRKPRRVRIGELTNNQIERHERRIRRAKREGFPRPKLPYKHADPGEPPRSATGFLKKFILYGYDKIEEWVVVGPLKSKTGTVHLLEHGGTAQLPGFRGKIFTMDFKGNPFMRPAEEKARPKLPQLFQNAL
ncbi:hypothetical protein [Thalassoglobus neptunius]|nr:hypothetical protein [Thalassoglobus neptunius]